MTINMKNIRPVIVAVTVLAAALFAHGMFTLPSPKPADADGFSSARVVKDIEVISREHHSVAHPKERAKVREYLVERLRTMGADTVMQFEYDSLVGPQNKHVTYTFDAVNVLAEFSPAVPSGDDTYLMMIAHYDSRYSQPMPKQDTVWSYGAADDGYGVGVILEMVSQALKRHDDWKQGIKVLFTDAEEVGMMGMKAAWADNKELFDNVGLILNVEARGTYGPALLFETCAGNEKVMKLYADAAKFPYTYSLTTVVYGFMPNFTDFTILKDEMPGMNFSSIADINHYHTDLDNFSNISEKTIQHYGEQILPVALAYLTDERFSDKDYLKGDKDTTNFTIPLLGLFNFSKTAYMILNIIVFILFILLAAIEILRGRVKFQVALRKAGIVLCIAIGVLAVGELVAYLCTAVAGARFKPFGVITGIRFDGIAMIASTVIMALVSVLIYVMFRKKAVRTVSSSMRASASRNAVMHHAYNLLYGALLLMCVLSTVLVFALGENLMFFIPLMLTTIAMILYHLTSLRLWILAAIAIILLHSFSFLWALATALTIGAFGAVAMLAFIDMMVLIPMVDLYLMPSKTRK